MSPHGRHDNPRRGALALGPLVLALGLALGGCEKAPVAPAATGEEQPAITFEGFTAYGTKAGARVWEAHAATAQVYSQRKVALVQDVTIRYVQKGRETSVASAREAEIGTESQDILARGNVEVRASNGVMLFTDHLRWDNQRQRLSTDARVRVVRKGSILTGRGLTADRNLEDVTVQRDVNILTTSVGEARQQYEELRQDAAKNGKVKP